MHIKVNCLHTAALSAWWCQKTQTSKLDFAIWIFPRSHLHSEPIINTHKTGQKAMCGFIMTGQNKLLCSNTRIWLPLAFKYIPRTKRQPTSCKNQARFPLPPPGFVTNLLPLTTPDWSLLTQIPPSIKMVGPTTVGCHLSSRLGFSDFSNLSSSKKVSIPYYQDTHSVGCSVSVTEADG